MNSWLDILLLLVSFLLLLPFLVLMIEALAASWGPGTTAQVRGPGIRCTVLIPAHNEELGLRTTLDALQLRPRLIGEEKVALPAITRVQAPRDEAHTLQAVEQPDQRDRLDIQDAGQTGLVDPRAARDVRQHLPLRAAEADTCGTRTLFEALAQQTRFVVDEETQGGFVPAGTMGHES